MIDHCKSSYSDPNLKWSQMDVESSECQVYADTATIVCTLCDQFYKKKE